MLIEFNGENRSPQLFPMPLSLYGTNPAGESLFRIVWSESRYYMVGANHTEYDGDPANDTTLQMRGKDPNVLRRKAEYRWLPLYPSVKAWVLECWKSPVAFTGCTQAQWNERYLDPQTGLLIIGPYPNRGEYCQCFTFPSPPSEATAAAVIQRIKAGWDYSYGEHKAAVEENEKKKEKSRFNKLKDIFKDSQQAFNNRPSSVRPGKRRKEDIKFKYSASDIPLHQRGFSSGKTVRG